MAIFTATLSQTAVLLVFIIIGYILSKWNFVPENAHTTLSKLENNCLVPALVMGTFIEQFTVDKITVARDLLLSSLGLTVLGIVVSVLLVRLFSKDRYERNIYAYGLCFSNFGFMGNAVVGALFPDIFLEYLIFTLPLWTLIYLYGVPNLLIGSASGEKATLSQRLKNFMNPMCISMVVGMVIGISGIPIPGFIQSAISSAGSCMSPVAMLLTGMTIAQFDLKNMLKIKGVYLSTFFRLVVYPLVFLGITMLLPKDFANSTFAICAICSLSMPTGLTSIIVPGAYGKDTRIASGMALVSHVLSCITIPVIFMLFQMI